MSRLASKRKITSVILCASLIAMTTGCGSDGATLRAEPGGGDQTVALPQEAEETQEIGEEQDRTVAALSLSAEEWYVRQTPGILVDENGYAAEEEKIAVFCGDVLPAVFEVRRDDTGETVFAGELRSSSQAADGGLLLATGDFTALTEPGDYYLYAPRLGESLAFSVGEDARGRLLQSLMKRYYFNRCGTSLTEEYAGEHAHGVCHSVDAYLAGEEETTLDVSGGWHMDERADRFAASGAEIVENLLLAYELNAAAFTDDTGIPESGNGVPDLLDEARVEVSWLLKMQDARLGGVYASALTVGDDGGNLLNAQVEVQPVSREASVAFAAALAKFSYHYRKYDSALATMCLRAADRAFTYYQYAAAGVDLDDAAFTAAAELYRATGREEYREVLAQFFAEEDFYGRVMEEPSLFIGAVTYLQTGQAVDVGAADRLMKTLTSAAERVADAANRSVFGAVFEGSDGEATDALLHEMQILAVSDHVSYSYEYTRLLTEHLHALCGRNRAARDYLTGFPGDAGTTGYPGILNQPVENAALTVAVAMMMSEG